jgi:hypothetical protein
LELESNCCRVCAATFLREKVENFPLFFKKTTYSKPCGETEREKTREGKKSDIVTTFFGRPEKKLKK